MLYFKFYYFYVLVLRTTSLLSGVIWFLIASLSVLSWFSFCKRALIALLYLGGFMVLFVYIIRLGGYMLKRRLVSFFLFFFFVFSCWVGSFSCDCWLLLSFFYSGVFVYFLLFQLLYLLFFLRVQLAPIKRVRIVCKFSLLRIQGFCLWGLIYTIFYA